MPDTQKQGIGGKLIERGLQILSESGVDLVFVLEHPECYPRFGFEPAEKLGLDATYTIPKKNADAWMIKALSTDAIETSSGKVICADTMNKREYWCE